jgi:hypothetical protein
MAFFAGGIFMIAFVSIFVLCIPYSKTDDWPMNFHASLPTFRFILMLICVIFGVAVDVKIFKLFKVNYLFIFELDPHYKLTHIQLFRVSLLLNQ